MAEKTKKKREDLNLLDDFLMKLVASDETVGKEFARILLGILLQREVRPLTVIPQKEFTAAGPDRHGIRLDVYLEEPGAGIFDIEPDRNRGRGQRGSFPRRARFYHSRMDSASVKSGEQYSSLRDVCVIFITDYDPFGCGRMVYTIRNRCEEEPGLPYDDGALTLFLYTRGTVGSQPEELRELLRYMEDSRAGNAASPKLKQIHSMVSRVKQDAEMGDMYMHFDEIIAWEREEGIKTGREESRKEAARNLFLNGAGLDLVHASIPEIPLEELEKMYAEAEKEKTGD